MNKVPTPIILSDDARAKAETRAHEAGFDSLHAYLTALIEDDREAGAVRGWMAEPIKDGLASPITGELSRKRLDSLIEDGIARVTRHAL